MALGFYEMMFQKASNYIYRVRKDMDSYFIRRANFKRLLDSSESLSVTKMNLKKMILFEYIDKIYRPIHEY